MKKLIIFSLLLSVFAAVITIIVLFINYNIDLTDIFNKIIILRENNNIVGTDPEDEGGAGPGSIDEKYILDIDPSGLHAIGIDPSGLEDKIEVLERDISLIKRYIDVNADYVLSISFIKRDIKIIKENIDKIRESNKLFFLVLVPLSLSVVGLSIAVIGKIYKP